MRGGRSAVIALALGTTALAVTGVSAHRLDECLQAARIAIEPQRAHIELDLTPGAAAAATIIASIDRDADGVFSAAERRDYVTALAASLAVEVDGHAVPLSVATSTFADAAAMRQGEGTIRLRATVALPPLAAGAHRLFFRNGFATDGSVYLANALVPESDRLAVTAQRHDTAQRELTIEYALLPDTPSASSWWVVGGLASALIAGLWRGRPKSGALSAALRHS